MLERRRRQKIVFDTGEYVRFTGRQWSTLAYLIVELLLKALVCDMLQGWGRPSGQRIAPSDVCCVGGW